MTKPFGILVCASVVLLLLVASLLILAETGCLFFGEVRVRFRFINASGKDVAVVSAHTHQTTRIPNQGTALVPHAEGDITVKHGDAEIWKYTNVSPLDFEGTTYVVSRQVPLPFGGATWTVNVLLDKDGRLYAIAPDAKDLEASKLKQPNGFPLTPDGKKGR